MSATTSQKTQQNNSQKTKTVTPQNVEKTKLYTKFSFWYRINDEALLGISKQAIDKSEYENQVKKIADFDTIEDFWAIFQHLRKPDSCKPGIEFQMFKSSVKPMWEDDSNRYGGKIQIKLKKDYTTIIWEELILAIIGHVLPEGIQSEINGIVVSIRKEVNVLQIWFRSFNPTIIKDIEQTIKELLQIPEGVEIDIKQFFREKNYQKQPFNNVNKNFTNNNGKQDPEQISEMLNSNSEIEKSQ